MYVRTSHHVYSYLHIAVPDDFDEPPSRPAPPQSQTGHQAPKFGMFRKIHSSTGLHESGFAPSSKRSQSVRKAGEQHQFENDKKDKKGGSKRISHLFKKKHHSYQPISEVKGPSDALEPSRASLPPLSNRRGTPTIDEEASLGGGVVRSEKTAMLPPARPLFRPASSPRLNMKSAESSKPTSSLAAAGSGGTGPKRRPARPPPPPPPYARKYGQEGLSELLKKQPSDEGDTEPSSGSGGVSPVPPREDTVSPASITMLIPAASPPMSVSPAGEEDEEEVELSPVKESKSMEELFKNLEEFDEFSGSTPPLTNGIHNKDKGERDFGTIPRDELPIKVEDDDEDEGEDDEATDESEAREGGTTPARTPDICVTEPSLESRPTLSVSSEPSKPSSPSPSASSVSSQPPAKPPRLRKKQALAKKQSKPTPAVPVASSKPQPPPKPPSESLLKEERERSSSPQPKAPPRRRSKKMSERMAQFEKKEDSKEEAKGSVSNAPRLGKLSPTPPAKPKNNKHLSALERSVCSSAPASRTASPDNKKNDGSGLVRESSSSTDHLESSSNPSRSPVVMRRTCAVVKGNEPQHSDDELDECTVRVCVCVCVCVITSSIIYSSQGVGKEGMLHKEGTQSVKWKARYFRLLDDRVIYYDNGSHSQVLGRRS